MKRKQLSPAVNAQCTLAVSLSTGVIITTAENIGWHKVSLHMYMYVHVIRIYVHVHGAHGLGRGMR